MIPTNPQPSFGSEHDARDFLEGLLSPWFYLKREVFLRYPGTTNTLRIDYLAKPKAEIGFPFGLLGIEVKRANRAGAFNRAVVQGMDYTNSLIVDGRESLARIRGQHLEYVYLFPAPTQDGNTHSDGWHAGVERVAGLRRVGLIYVKRNDRPQFCMSAERHWDPDYGGRAGALHTRNNIGNATLRRPEEAQP